jgi:hypothetical protein
MTRRQDDLMQFIAAMAAISAAAFGLTAAMYLAAG